MTDRNLAVPEGIKIQIQIQSYLDRAVEYYIFARKAVMLGVVPVGGNMFHFAVEMLLRSGLSFTHSSEQLRDKFHNHDLNKIWLEFKEKYPDRNLDKFDQFISRHRTWEQLRYPSAGRGYAIFFGPNRQNPEVMKKNKMALRGSPSLEINLEGMDEFMTNIIRVIGINGDYIKIHLQHNPELIEMYLDKNLSPLFERGVVSGSYSLLVS